MLPEAGVVVFDLDDTLYPERDFVSSGFRAAAGVITDRIKTDVFCRIVDLFEAGESDPFGRVLAESGLAAELKGQLIQAYRNHMPTLMLVAEVVEMLNSLRASGRSLGIITDGRSVTQRNKIRALGLDAWIDAIVISEEFGSAKPEVRNYRYFEEHFPGQQFVYVGNDIEKDFVAPNRLGWQTVGLRHNARHIHLPPQESVPVLALPQFWIDRLA
jgi:putative hydrolase of the HAD superfamily